VFRSDESTQGNAPTAVDGKNYFKEGKGIPAPLLVRRFAGQGGWDLPCQDILGLTKMNWNNDGLYDRLPATLSYAQVLARTVKIMPQLEARPYQFRFFMCTAQPRLATAGLLALDGLLLALGGFFAPDLALRSQASRRRRDFRHALSAFLDLVVIALAAGGGVDSALTDAARVGTGESFAALRRALDAARLARIAPWGPLGRLGDELGINELSELAASVSLAGSEGAKVRESLAAKAASLRAHALADAEGEAQAATEAMSLPVVVLFAGFLVFLGFPALAHVFGAL
jgi:hypothetical protein